MERSHRLRAIDSHSRAIAESAADVGRGVMNRMLFIQVNQDNIPRLRTGNFK